MVEKEGESVKAIMVFPAYCFSHGLLLFLNHFSSLSSPPPRQRLKLLFDAKILLSL